MTIQELERLIALYGKDIFSFCVHLTGSGQEAEELYQDAFLKAVERIADIREDGNQKSYILSVALNLWKNRRRKFAWRQRIAPEKELSCGGDYPEAETAEDVLSGLLREERLRTAFGQISDSRTAVLYGRAVRGGYCQDHADPGGYGKEQAQRSKEAAEKRTGGLFL